MQGDARETEQNVNQEGTATSNDPTPVHIYSTGLPGRPTIRHLIEQEFERRVTDKVFETTLRREAEVLLKWVETTHPQAPTPTAKSIENLIRSQYREAKSRNEQTNEEKP